MKTIHKRIISYQYQQRGEPPKADYLWELHVDGKMVDSSYRLKDLKAEHPDAVRGPDIAPSKK